MITLVLALVLLVSPSYLAGPAWAQGPDGKAVYYVAPGGDCGGQAPCFAALQAAVDAVDHRNDVIKVAAGTYGGVQTVGGLTQVVHIAKDLTLQGGYSRSDWETSDPARNETVIDALGQGRALVVDGARVTLQGLTFTGGDAMAGGSLDRYNRDLGGGLYLRGATVTLRHCQIRGNVAGSAENYLSGGGGLAATDSTLTLENCLITENVAAEAGQGQGGGMWLDSTVAQLTYTALISNTASLVAEGRGGGLYSDFGSLQMTDCEVRDNRAGLAGEWWTSLGGGGVYATNGEASFLDNTFRGNVGNYGEGLIDAYGGGLMVASVVQGRRLTISGNTFEDNIASRGGYGFGGGLSVAGYHAEISDNTFRHNIAGAFNGAGGGLHVGSDIVEPISYITITNNVFTDNIAADLYTGNGGGLFIGEIYDVGRNMAASVLVQNNQVRNNTASVQGFGAGGGITIGANAVEVKIYNNQIVANAAGRSSRESRGGGIFFMGSQGVVRDTLIQSNVASVDGLGRGGGVAVLMADVFLRRSVIDGNIASQTGEGEGGGVWCAGVWAAPGKTPTPIPVKLTNNMVTRNQAATAGSGLWFGGGVGNATLKHNTIADNSAGVGQGMWVAKDYAVTGTNTIFAGHSAGVYADQDARVTLDKSLWHNNAKQSDGPGTVTKTNNLSGDPKFVNSAAGDYHIGPGSAALDRAVNANVTDDIDLQQRPQDSGYDIGADEYVYVPPPPTPTRTHLYLPLNIKD